MDITDRVIQIAKDKGISIKSLEREAGLGNGTIKNWKKSSPQCNKLLLISEYLNVSFEWLVTGNLPNIEISNQEKELLNYYKNARPEVQESVMLLLKAGQKQSEQSYNSKTG